MITLAICLWVLFSKFIKNDTTKTPHEHLVDNEEKNCLKNITKGKNHV